MIAPWKKSPVIFWLILLLLTPVLVGAICLLFVIRGFNQVPELPAHCAFVFGARVYGTDSPGTGIIRRVSKAVELYDNKQVSRLIMAGGVGDKGQRSEAEVMKTLAMKLGVPAKDIATEDRSRSTWENIDYGKSLIDRCNSVVGISDRYHLTRIKLIAWKFNVDMSLLGVKAPSIMFELRNSFREVIALLYYSRALAF